MSTIKEYAVVVVAAISWLVLMGGLTTAFGVGGWMAGIGATGLWWANGLARKYDIDPGDRHYYLAGIHHEPEYMKRDRIFMQQVADELERRRRESRGVAT